MGVYKNDAGSILFQDRKKGDVLEVEIETNFKSEKMMSKHDFQFILFWLVHVCPQKSFKKPPDYYSICVSSNSLSVRPKGIDCLQ